MNPSQPLHGSVVARHGPHGRDGVLIVGPSGAGKSDLALRLVGRRWRLVGDDYVHVFPSGAGLFAAAAPAIAGLIEVRGQGPRPVCPAPPTRLVLLVDLAGGPRERLPEPEFRSIQGRDLPVLRLDPFETSAVEKVAAALGRL